ncbi:hypothetical protein BC628DRAFT_652678 [Trametes gibbosa]|nr:hypothetical protein BC628DRAFT_652678 [Trametes gibbosa]
MNPQTDRQRRVVEICLYDYRSMPGMTGRKPPPRSQPHPSQYVVNLERQLAEGNKVACGIERALRYITGAETQGKPCEEGALFFLDPIISPKPDTIDDWDPTASTPTLNMEALTVQAHSIAAYAYYRKYTAPTKHLEAIVEESTGRFARPEYQTHADDHFENIMNAARHATHAAAIDFVSPAVLLAGFAFKTLVEYVGIDLGAIPLYRPLWRVLERWLRERAAAEAEAKMGHGVVEERPAGDCGARKCTSTFAWGADPVAWTCECASDVRPWYCNIECQDHDWLRHQKVCATRGSIPTPFYIETQYELARGVLGGMLILLEPLVHVEIMTDEDRLDPRNGDVLCESDLPCPFGTPGRWVRYVVKQYRWISE